MISRFLTIVIRIYQATLSPLLGSCCRFHPSCSQYSLEAIETHGALKGIALAVRRVLRCHPFNDGGHDPVPCRTSGADGREDPRQMKVTHG